MALATRLLFLLVSIGFATSALAKGEPEKTKTVDLSKGESRVEFLAVGKPSAIKIRGNGGSVRGVIGVSDSSVSGTVDFDLESLDTGIGLRNSHMKEKYLQTGQFPKAVLNLGRVALPTGWTREPSKHEQVDFEGVLSLHGVERPLTGKLDLHHDGKLVDGAARFKVKISDFGIEVPSYAGITVADEVEVQTHFKSALDSTAGSMN